jgi:hypothetical protein
MRMRIQVTKKMRINADPDADLDPQVTTTLASTTRNQRAPQLAARKKLERVKKD